MTLDEAVTLKEEIRSRFLNGDLLPESEPIGFAVRSRPIPLSKVHRQKRTLRYLDAASHISLGVEQTDPFCADHFRVVARYGRARLQPYVRRIQQAVGLANVRAVKVGRIRTVGGVSGVFKGPLTLGSSVSHHRAMAGTLGAFVDVVGCDAPCLLSNNHVIAYLTGAPGDAVIHPGRGGSSHRLPHTVARLHEAVPIDFAPQASNEVDCAVARLEVPYPENLAKLPASVQRDDGLTPPSHISGPISGRIRPFQLVWKYGATTGWRCGQIVGIEQDAKVAIDTRDGRRTAVFNGQVVVSGFDGVAFAKAGDSGSVAVLSDGSVLGLVFATSDEGGDEGSSLAFVNPIAPVLSRLGASLCV